MKKTFLCFVLALLLATPAAANIIHNEMGDELFRSDDVDFEIDDEVITLEHGRDTVVFDDDGRLWINDDEIELGRDQQRLVVDFHDGAIELVEEAEAIGIAGARIGVEGVELALKAIGKVVKLLDEDYDSEDLEAEMEAESERIEQKAEALEEVAEELEEVAEELEDTVDDLRDEVDELDELRWF